MMDRTSELLQNIQQEKDWWEDPDSILQEFNGGKKNGVMYLKGQEELKESFQKCNILLWNNMH